MTADNLLSCLDFVKSTGSGKWIARCPHHDDRSPSLSITEKDDGRVLIHCHAGCGAAEVLDAVGLGYSALFPEDLSRNYHAERKAEDRSVDELVVAIAAADRKAGKRLSDEDKERELEAMLRLHDGEPSPEPDSFEQQFMSYAKKLAEENAKL